MLDPSDCSPHRRHLRALPSLLRAAPVQQRSGPPYGAVVGVLQTVLQMIESGDTYLGVATDHVIESFRNRLWAGYKTGAGIGPALLAQFHQMGQETRVTLGEKSFSPVEISSFIHSRRRSGPWALSYGR